MSAPSGPTSIGSLDPKVAPWRITFATSGAGIAEIVFSDYWMSMEAATAARRAAAGAEGVAMPPDADRFVLARATDLAGYVVPVLAARAVEIDGEQVNLFGQTWAQAAPGAFVTEIVDASGTVVARLERAFAVGADAHDLVVAQRFTNLTSAPVKVRWIQYGPSDLPFDPGALLEVRRFHFGYLFPPERDPSQAFVSANGQMLERSKVSSQITDGQPTLWPNRASTDG
ncbi:MAG: hypothetical protein EBU70_15635, partial [Actinobacteria bacterium]|nr:hypothetical protein [Actinomycetota bacterium]